MTALTPIERGAEAVYKLYDQVYTMTASDIPRAVFESIDREGLIDVLVMSPMSDFAGTDMRPVERTADAIRAWLLSEGGA